MISKMRQPKLQILRVLFKSPLRTNSGGRRPLGVTGSLSGSEKKYAIQNGSGQGWRIATNMEGMGDLTERYIPAPISDNLILKPWE